MKALQLGRTHGGRGVLATALVMLLTAAAVDPVEELRQALPLDDVSNPTPEMLKFRRDNLQKKIDALREIGQLRRALALDEWRDDPSRAVVDDRIRRIDFEMRKQVGDRLSKRLDDEARSPDANSRLAVANMIAEIGPTIRALGPDDKSGYARSLTPQVLLLSQDRDLGVRQEALRALGTINARPTDATKVFVQVLKSDPASGPRRLAAEGLGQLIRVVTHLQKRGRTAAGVESTQQEAITTLLEVVAVVPVGAGDADAYVRHLCLDALQTAAQATSDLIPDAFPRKEFPPIGRPLAEFESKKIAESYDEVRREIEAVKPILAAFNANHGVIAAGLADADGRVRLSAAQALMQSAWAGQRLQQRAMSLPLVPAEGRDPKKMLGGADPLATFMQKDLAAVASVFRDPDARIRKLAGYALLLLEDRALPLVDVLRTNLADQDRAVRWAAAKTLSYLPAASITNTVSGLAALLCDPDLQVRTTAADTLAGMGKLAQGALAALAEATTTGDVDGRKAAMAAILAMGPDIAKGAVPQLIIVLQQTDADAKAVVAAAQSLGQIGPGASSAVPALRRLIGHDDAEVRQAASEAILAITGRRE